MRKNVYFKRIKQSILATAVAVCCVVGCDNVELSFADTATMSDATLSDATAGDTDREDSTDPVGEDTGENSVVRDEGESPEDCDTVCAEISESSALREIPEQSVDEGDRKSVV